MRSMRSDGVKERMGEGRIEEVDLRVRSIWEVGSRKGEEIWVRDPKCGLGRFRGRLLGERSARLMGESARAVRILQTQFIDGARVARRYRVQSRER